MDLENTKVVFKKSEENPIYINNVSINSTYFDFLFSFRVSSITEEGDGTVVNTEELLKVVMSPQHAKAFVQALDRQIKIYEGNFGELQVPKESVNGGDK